MKGKTKLLNTGTTIRALLSSADKAEIQKCKESVFYFYNKYVLVEGQEKLTEKEFKDVLKRIESQRNTVYLRGRQSSYLLSQSECFTKGT